VKDELKQPIAGVVSQIGENIATTDETASIVPRVFENAEQGKHFTYIITATNGGNKVATGVTLEYPLPDGTELVEVRGDGVCEQVNDGNTVTRSTTVKPYLSVFGTAKPSPIVMNGTLHYEFAIELNDNASEQVATGISPR